MGGQNNSTSQPTYIVKTKNVDVSMKCVLTSKHEKLNENATVRWWFKKICKVPCWSLDKEDEDEEWQQIDCNGGPCKISMDLNDDNASNGLFMCKIFPYKIADAPQSTLWIEITKTFQVEINGEWLKTARAKSLT